MGQTTFFKSVTCPLYYFIRDYDKNLVFCLIYATISHGLYN